jgi:hypothetical protein
MLRTERRPGPRAKHFINGSKRLLSTPCFLSRRAIATSSIVLSGIVSERNKFAGGSRSREMS